MESIIGPFGLSSALDPSELGLASQLYRDNAYYTLLGDRSVVLGSSGDFQAPGSGVAVSWIIQPQETIQVDGLQFYTQIAGAAGKKARVALYPIVSGLLGPELLCDWVEHAIDSIGWKKIEGQTPVILLGGGLYGGTIVANDAAFAYRHPAGGLPGASGVYFDLGMASAGSSNRFTSLSGALAYGPLPAIPPVLAPSETIRPPFVAWRVQRV